MEGVAIDLLQLYRAWLGVCRAMFAAWSRLTSVRLLLIAGAIPKIQNFRFVLFKLITDALKVLDSLIYLPQVMAHAAKDRSD